MSRSYREERGLNLLLTVVILVCLSHAPVAFSLPPGGGGPGGHDAIDNLRHASSPDGKNAKSFIESADRKEKAGDFNGAISDYTMAIGIDPRSESAHYYRGYLYSSLGRLSEAIADLDVVIRENSKASDAYYIRGEAHADMGHVQPARADYESAIRYADSTAEGNIIQADAHYEKGDYAKAALWYARAQHKAWRDPYTLTCIAWFKATCPEGTFRNGKLALQESTKACELTKWKDVDVLDTLAAAYAETGDFTQAIKYEMQALERIPIAPVLAKGMRERLHLYQAHQPFRDVPKLQRTGNRAADKSP